LPLVPNLPERAPPDPVHAHIPARITKAQFRPTPPEVYQQLPFA
jgi:hypothetical protein